MAKRNRHIDIHYPILGVDRRYAYQAQRPYTTPRALNCRPDAPLEGRARGGSRDGLDKAFYEELGDGNPVRMLAHVTRVTADGWREWTDRFPGDELAPLWTKPAWKDHKPAVSAYNFVVTNADVGAVLPTINNLDTSSNYQISIYIMPYEAAHHGSYEIYARMDDSTPDATNEGIIATLTMEGKTGAWSGTLVEYNDGEETSTDFATTGSPTGQADGGWFRVLISEDNVKCYWRGVLLTNTDVTAHSGTRIGFGMVCVVTEGVCLTDVFQIQYHVGTVDTPRNILVASDNGTVYREGLGGTMDTLTLDATISSSKHVIAVDRGQKLWIADHDDELVQASNGVADAGGTTITTPAITETIAGNVAADDHVCLISAGTGNVTNGTYGITSAESGSLVLATSCGSTGNCSIRITRQAKVYDPSDDSMVIWEATSGLGAVPTDCPIIALYRDRLWLAGSPTAPHVMTCCRQSDPYDWDVDAADADRQRAWSGTTEKAGRPGQPISALCPWMDDYMMVGCEHQLYVLRGDPTYGNLEVKSLIVGVVDKQSWCFGPESQFIFLSHDGLYAVPPGGAGFPESLSRERMPEDLLNLDRTTHTILLAYDARRRGIHIFITANDAGMSDYHWWFDWRTKGFNPDDYPADYEPTACVFHPSDIPTENAVILGGRDGYLRRFRPGIEADCGGVEIESYVRLGPIRLGGNAYTDGILLSMAGTLGAGSGDVTWTVYTADSAEGLVTASAGPTGTWTAGRNYTVWPNRRGGAMIVELGNAEADRAWAFEGIAALVKPGAVQVVL